MLGTRTCCIGLARALDVSGVTDTESGCAEVLSEQEYPVQRYIITLI